MDLLDDARLAILQQRSVNGTAAAPTSADLLRIATLGGARSLGVPHAGALAPGELADIAAFPLDPVRDTPFFGVEDALVFGQGGRRASMVMVDGVELVRGGRLLRDVREDVRVVQETARELESLR